MSLLENSLEDAYVNLSTINQDISRMSSGSKPFSAQFLAVKNELERELSKLHKDAKVQIYCDLVDIVDKRWTKAIEVAIYAQKFNLFVNEEYFEEADAILKQISLIYLTSIPLSLSHSTDRRTHSGTDTDIESTACLSP